ncbi:MAG TPA: hypothetical protein VKR58_12505, partial [Aquella sp.]|nr:hypothetical protein [Aquella sp.]
MQWYNLETCNEKEIWHGRNISRIAFNSIENSIAFLTVPNVSDQSLNTISYYSDNMDSAELWVSASNPGIKNGLIIGDRDLFFSADGHKLFFQLQYGKVIKFKDSPLTDVHIWNSKDQSLRSVKDIEDEREKDEFYLSLCKLPGKQVIRLQNENDGGLTYFHVGENGNAEFALSTSKANLYEAYFRKLGSPNINLISTNNGERICIKRNVYFAQPTYSPGGKFILWYDYLEQKYFVYDIRQQQLRCITNGIQNKLYVESWDYASLPEPYSYSAWIEGDSAVLIYDHYDIWKVDPYGIVPPTNLTNGYGKKNKIIFRYVDKEHLGTELMHSLNKRETILLCAFNEKTKENGFYEKTIDETGDPKKLVMSPDLYYFNENNSYITFPDFMVKAKQTNVYLIKKMNTAEFPNLYLTS